ncbi:ubiquitin-conjugating enzyme E2 W-like isoform X3 [Tachysurus fulvidraco]|uniref:ubiquitin-conjugating enzyme E2 W-like isoform X3 n=1 Tax=Tachysurus fulvidraco TaxID=1234273 RepID=UPI001FED8ADF|nr:ubiquitin-conjugating enzyme E2 W-like isoform X3 [Tachysurus fulvidraco]
MVCMQRRLQKEWLALQNDPPPGMTLKERRVQNTTTEWVIELKGSPRTQYEGQKFQLLFTFSSQFPFEPPQVMFTGENIPAVPFVDSNGHIRLSSLTVMEWTPVLTVRVVHPTIPQRRESGGVGGSTMTRVSSTGTFSSYNQAHTQYTGSFQSYRNEWTSLEKRRFGTVTLQQAKKT